MLSKTIDFRDCWAQVPWAHGTLLPIGIFMPIDDKNKWTVLMIYNYCHRMQNVGQTIYVAGALCLCKVLEVIVAVVVYSRHK